MGERRSAVARTILVSAGVLAVGHGIYGFLAYDPSGPPCHFCAVAPGLGGAFLEVLVGPSVAAVGATVSGGPAIPIPDIRFGSLERKLLRVGAVLPVVVLVFGALSAGYGFVLAFPLVLLGWFLVAVGVGLRAFRWTKRRRRNGPKRQE